MFWYFKFFPDWTWPALVVAALVVLVVAAVPLLKPYKLPLQLTGAAALLVGLWLSGMWYADSTWQQAARDLQAKVVIAEAQSQQVNTVIKERVVTKLEVVKVRGDEITKYIDREVTKYDTTCKIPEEFVVIHNRAAEPPK